MVYPKYITGLFEEVPYPDYLESILSIHIDEFDNIVIESRIGDEHPVHNFHGYFMVKDLKGKRTAFTVTIKSASINDSPPDPLPEIPVAPGEYYWVNY